MISLMIGLFFGFSPWAEANTQVLFNREGNQATVVLMGMPGDSDPAGFWRALRIPAEDFQGKLSKKLQVPAGESGVRPFDAACVFSKVIEDNGTCTLIFRQADGVGLVDRGAGKARLFLTGDEAVRVAEAFVLPEESNVIFRSRDGKLQASFVREEGRVKWLVIDWNGRGIF